MRNLIFIIFLALASCQADQDLIELHFKAAFARPQCAGLKPSLVKIQIGERSLDLEAWEVPGGIQTETFNLEPGPVQIFAVEVFNAEGIRTHYVKSEKDSDLVGVWTENWIHRVDHVTPWISGQIFCN